MDKGEQYKKTAHETCVWQLATSPELPWGLSSFYEHCMTAGGRDGDRATTKKLHTTVFIGAKSHSPSAGKKGKVSQASL